MSNFKKAIMWLVMLNKRLYKRPAFIIMLCVICCLTACLNFFSNDDSHILKISIYAENDSVVSFLQNFTAEDQLIKYTYCASEEDALDLLNNKGWDATWIFRKDIDDAAENFIVNSDKMVEIIQREETVFLRLSREKLFSYMYPRISRALYNNYMYKTFNEENREILKEFYDSEVTYDKIVEVKFSNSTDDIDDLNYLIGPVRGLLSITLFLCGYAALIMFKKDKGKGMLGRLPISKHIFVEIGSIFVVMLNASAITLVALRFSGLFTTWGIETVFILVYALSCISFCVLFGEIVDNENVMSAIIPILAILMIVFCPVFINTKKLEFLQYLLPPYYYLSAFRNDEYLIYGIYYIVITSIFCIGIRYIKNK